MLRVPAPDADTAGRANLERPCLDPATENGLDEPGTPYSVALDWGDRMATATHDVLESLDWPAMTSRFRGRAGAFATALGADGRLGLLDHGVAATETGMALAVTPDGKLPLEHGPIPDLLGWQAMTMHLRLLEGTGITGGVSSGDEVTTMLIKGDDGMYVVGAILPNW
ncbi:copper-binding protein [Tropicimonas sediminicola]|uniref:Membrane fusion protein, Cu(I)/Ag(I) efflux system n=1 Tax=Tropicimonas sediminicola TaxID=1031541 RepID=A0A239FQ63_9RHOB|nr:copper-binding protein [Tropicimonas sediminicola]SNS59041.1 membrane fusion protein, Cu(I)/Ag(I) efflux system [Tropicimonas sediminicola]